MRYVQVWSGQGQPWDNHDDLADNHRRLARQCDQAIAALLMISCSGQEKGGNEAAGAQHDDRDVGIPRVPGLHHQKGTRVMRTSNVRGPRT